MTFPPDPRDILGRLPDPLGIFQKPEEQSSEEIRQNQTESAGSTITTEGCAYGLECIRDHFLRAHLYLLEAVRFSSSGELTDAARQKIRQARQQLLCEDDFAAAMGIGTPLQYEAMKLLASTRSCWKAIEDSGLDRDSGTLEEMRELADAVKGLYEEAYRLDSEFRKSVRADA